MKFSLIIATLNREQELKHMVDSILNQTYQNFEIIIVDQSDVENKHIGKIDKRIKYYHITEKGLSHARNIGLQYVTGDIVGLSDDDAEYDKNTFSIVLDEFAKGADFVSGIVIDKKTNDIILNNMKQKRESITCNNVFRTSISASLFISRDLFDICIFDENFGIGAKWGSGEESDVVLQFLYKNCIGVFNPNIIVYHPVVKKNKLDLEKVKKYSKGFGALIAKHYYDFNNRKIILYYYKALFKHVAGLVLSALKLNKHMIKFYWISIVCKKEGFREYKKSFKKLGSDF